MRPSARAITIRAVPTSHVMGSGEAPLAFVWSVDRKTSRQFTKTQRYAT